MGNSVATALRVTRIKAFAYQLVGWFLAIPCALITAVGGIQIAEVMDVVMVSFFAALTALAVLSIIKGHRLSSLVCLFPEYSAWLDADKENCVAFLASATGTSVASVSKKLRAMMKLGFFPSCFFDVKSGKVIEPEEPQPEVQYTVVQCSGCGGTNKVAVGTVAECKFCGLPISAAQK